ncbi:MAG: sucrose-6-phosphate hydrolase, partial [Leuconostoc sp. DORA_2]
DIISLHFDAANQEFQLIHHAHPQDDRFATIEQSSEITLALYIDKSIVEIFVQNGAAVFTERFYTNAPPVIRINGNNLLGHFMIYQLDAQ